MKTYLFYDVETSGLNPAFDQILTFACIRTDLSLNEIDRQTITIQLRKDIVPSPRAFLTHGLTIDELNCGITEYHAAKKIHKLVNTPGTISLGYNSLGFDDEFLRFLFYRNLLDPYSHQYSSGCSRMDILPVATIYRVFHPQVLNWPQIDGKDSLKLDLISQANSFETSGRAHEAMNDVEALIALTRVLYAQENIWKYCLDFFNKNRDEIRINSIEKGFKVNGEQSPIGILVSASFGSQVNYISPAVHIGSSVPYKNQGLWLRLDSEDILSLDETLPLSETFVTRKRPADALVVLPALERFWAKLSDIVRQRVTDNIEKICNNSDRYSQFIQYHRNFKYSIIDDMDIDAALYQDGFFTREEKKQIQIFHTALEHEKDDILSEIKSHRIYLLAKRILARNIEGEITEKFGDSLRLDDLRKKENNIVIGYKNDAKLTCEDALMDLDKLEKELLTPDLWQRQMLLWLRNYIENL